MGKQGTIEVAGSSEVVKPLSSQVFLSNFAEKPRFEGGNSPGTVYSYEKPRFEGKIQQETAYSFEKPKFEGKKPQETAYSYEKNENPRQARQPDPFSRKQTHSAKPYRNLEVLKREEIKTSQGVKYPEDYTPYTLKDYQVIKNDKYYELGGLGPSNLGTDEWKQRKEMLDKRISYAKHVKLANANLLPPSNRKAKEPEKEISKNERAAQFAKMIPKPAPKNKSQKSEVPVALNSVLDELEKQHLAYKASVDAIKSGYNG